MVADWTEVSGNGNGQPQMVDIEWKGYGNALRTGFWKLFTDELLMDVRLGPGDGLKMHKFVLAMFFGGMSDKVMSKLNSPTTCDIDLDELFSSVDAIDVGVVRKLLEFTYSGRVSVPIQSLNKILCFAEAVGFDGLVDCIKTLEEQIHLELQKTVEVEVIDINESNGVASIDVIENNRVLEGNNQPRGRVEVTSKRRKSRKGLPVKISYGVRNTRSSTADQSRLVESKSEAVKKKTRKKEVPKVVIASNESSSEVVEDEVPCNPDESSQESESDEKTKERPTKKVTKIKKRLADNGDDGSEKIKRKYKKKKLSCDQCDYVTTNKITYINHLSKHDPSIDVQHFECDVCSKKFRSQHGFNCHVKMHSDPDKQFCCLHCSFTTGQKNSWQKHMAVIHKLDAESGRELVAELRCEQCEFECVAMHQLKAHRQRKHPIEKQFKCTECTYETVYRNQLSRHVSTVHRKERRYMCDACGFRSQTPGGLERHRRSHLGIKPFKCEECGQSYADRGKYKMHVLRHKNKEMPFVCHICAYSCRCRGYLIIHMNRAHHMTLDNENSIFQHGRQNQFQTGVEHEQQEKSTPNMSLF